jgi:hypothetical protein
MQFLRVAAVILGLFAITGVQLAFGQGAVTTGTISGDVYDKSGAVIAGAKVVITNQDTDLKKELATDSSGHFTATSLAAGRYVVDVSKEGFKSSAIRDFTLNVGAAPNIKFNLDLGQVSETVEVQAESVAPIETTKTEVSSVIQEEQVRELPLNQRSFTALVTQQPGLVVMTNASGNSTQTPTSVAFAQGSQISSGGQVSQSMAYLVDGVNINNSGFGAPGTAAGGDIPGVEAIQEFKVLTHNYSAAYGGSAGGVVSFATRSGTNQLHGSAYEFFRNDVLDARDYFDTLPSKPPYKRNQFGGTIGGPIVKDKTFFFVNYEGLRSRFTSTDIGNVPNLCARNSGVGGSGVGCPTDGEGNPITVPVTDALGNPVAISSGVQSVLSLYPLPNGTDFGNGIAQYIFLNPQPVRQDFGLVRFDQALTSKDSLTVRYSITDASGNNDYFLPTYVFDKYDRLQSAVAKWTRTINPNLVNTLSAAFARSYLTAIVNPAVPLPPDALTGDPARGVVGTISVGSATSGNTSGAISTIGLDNWGPFREGKNIFPVNDDVIYTKGKHTLRFGGQFTPYQWNWSKGNLIGGGWTFNNLTQLLAGDPAVLIIRVDGANPNWKYRTKQFGFYGEDAWRVNPKLTLTLGLRYEFQTPVLSEAHNPTRIGNTRTRDQGLPTPGQPYHNYTTHQFAPRIGIAYDPFGDGKTVIRTGFGLFYDMIPLEAVAGEISYNDPNPTLNTFFGAPNAPGFLPQIPFPSCSAPASGFPVGCTANSGYPGLLTGVLEPVRAPTSAQWNLQFERELPWNLKAAFTYTGSQTWNIMRGIEGNSNLPCPASVSSPTGQRPFFGPYTDSEGTVHPNCGTAAPGIAGVAFTLYAVVFDAHSNYNAGTFTLSRQFRQSLGFSSSFTWAHAISESDTNNSGAILLGNASHSENPLDRHADRSESMFSFRRRWTLNGVWELPFGRGKKYLGDSSAIEQAVLGGWQVNTLLDIRDGIPFSVLAGGGITNVGDNLTFPDRPNILRKNPVLGGVNHYFDPMAYSLQHQGYLGTAPRNSVIGPGFAQWDLSFAKNFKITERNNLEFRAEMFNAVNHPNFDLPANQLYVPGGGGVETGCNLTPAQQAAWSCNPQAGLITKTVAIPRQIQFGLKWTF